MDLVIADSGGENIVAREMGVPDWMPDATVEAHEVEVFAQEVDRATGGLVGARRSLGRYAPDAKLVIENKQTADRDVRVFAMPYSADGAAGFTSLTDATQLTVLVQRETAAPEIGQGGDATTESATVGVRGYTPFARARRVRIASALDGSGHLATPYLFEEVFDSTPDAPPREIDITRGAGPQTVYVAVAHSSGAGRGAPGSHGL